MAQLYTTRWIKKMALYSSNFSSNSLSGTVRVSGGQAVVDVGVNLFALQGDKTFKINLRKDSVDGPILASSPNITIEDRSEFLNLTANVASVAEGGLVRFELTTANVYDGSAVWFSIEPVTANVTAEDFTANTGSFFIVGNQAILDLQASRNTSVIDEAGETFKFQLRAGSPSGNIVYTTANISIDDTYKTFFANTFVESSNIAFESGSLTLTFNFRNTPLGSTIYYDTVGNVSNSSFVSGNTGSFVYNGSNVNLVFSVNPTIPVGQIQDFQVRLKQDSLQGNVFAISNKLYAADAAAAYNQGTGGDYVFHWLGYKTHVFTTSGTFEFTQGTNPSFNTVDYYLVGGGGAGGIYYGGGGGAGGMLAYEANVISSNTYNIVIGSGGVTVPSGPRQPGTPFSELYGTGSNTSAFGLVAYGGGGGGSGTYPHPINPTGIRDGGPGGSGGGAGSRVSQYGSTLGGAGVAGQGNPGGPGAYNIYDNLGGGGGSGGAGVVRNGGKGTSIPWFTYRGTGSQVGMRNPVNGGFSPVTHTLEYDQGRATTAARGFSGGGWSYAGPVGNGPVAGGAVNEYSAAIASGGGGGGFGPSGPGGSGGSGVVIIRYPYPFNDVLNITVANTFSTVFNSPSNIAVAVRTFNATGNTLYLSTDGNVTYDDIWGGNIKTFTVGANDYATVNYPIQNTLADGETREFRFVVKNSLGSILATSSNAYTIQGGAFIGATGGTIISSGGYNYHVFTNVGNTNFTISSVSPNPSYNQLDYLVVGAGGTTNYYPHPQYGSGGAGAGGFVTGNLSISSTGTYSMKVGHRMNFNNYPGNPSYFMFGHPGFVEAYGGGAGGNWSLHVSYGYKTRGGSGGGANPNGGGYLSDGGYAYGSVPPSDYENTATKTLYRVAGSQGYPGGMRQNSPPYQQPNGDGAGGGGAGGAGANATSYQYWTPAYGAATKGGVGASVPWLTNTALSAYGTPGPDPELRYFAGGGHGSQQTFDMNQPEPSGRKYWGGGGGGGQQAVYNSGAGGSFGPGASFYGADGIIIVRYPFN